MDGHPYELTKLDAHLRERIADARAERTEQIFDEMVRLLLAAERWDWTSAYHIRLAAERVFVISAAFDGVDVDACVIRLASR